MKEEFTTKMHSELIGKEISESDFKIMGIFGAIRRGFSLQEACKKYDVDENYYLKNYKRVIFNG